MNSFASSTPAPDGRQRTGLKARGFRNFINFDPHAAKSPIPRGTDEPGPGQTVEILRVSQIPFAVRTALALAVRALVVGELTDKEYDKVDVRKKVKFIELPAPTLRDPGRKKKHQILGIRQQYHVQAQMDGPPGIQITHMPYLRSRGGETGWLMFVVRSTLPVRGRVGYRIPDVLSASTGFRTEVSLTMVGQLRVDKSGDQISLDPPELLDFRVELHALELSNDILHTARRPIEELINHELRQRHDRIRDQANKALHKAVQAREFRNPLLRYL